MLDISTNAKELILNLPEWAQTQVFIIMASIIGCLLVLLPLLVRYIVMQSNSKRQNVLFQEWQTQQFVLQSKIGLLTQELEQQRTQNIAMAEKADNEILKWSQEHKTLQISNTEQEGQIGRLSQKANELDELKQHHHHLQMKFQELQANMSELQAHFEAQQAAIAQERKAFEEKFLLLQDAEKHLNTQFENLANKIFEQKAEKFTKTSEHGINHLLSPLKQQIDDFKKQIGDQYIKEGQERASLKTEILGLKELNLQITQEAAALTNALKGDNKQQGNWGEVVLSRILDESGLREGHEYEIQKHLVADDGKRYRPDVVVHLPNQKDIVVDSKVSLVAHEKVVNAESDEDRKRALKEHIASIKGHIKGLSKKDYQDLAGVKTLDYVLMFVPIESAFISAVQSEPELVKLAMDNQIMLVSPTNLLVALRTINNIWQYEYQNQHAKTIADKAKKMYDKFAGFVEDMQKIGKNMETLEKSYDAAMNKLSSGRGNLIGQAESFKGLGVTPTKSIDKELLGADVGDDSP